MIQVQPLLPLVVQRPVIPPVVVTLRLKRTVFSSGQAKMMLLCT